MHNEMSRDSVLVLTETNQRPNMGIEIRGRGKGNHRDHQDAYVYKVLARYKRAGCPFCKTSTEGIKDHNSSL